MVSATSKPVMTLPKDHAMCPRCGRVREVRRSRVPGLCMDCRSTLTTAERKMWAA